jgi:opacity protein-like surface antigen
MIRSYLLAAALAAGLAFPAFAADTVANAGNAFTQENARQHLLHLGYANVSQLQKDAHGNWAGTAINKDGKTVPVVVGVKGGATGAN